MRNRNVTRLVAVAMAGLLLWGAMHAIGLVRLILTLWGARDDEPPTVKQAAARLSVSPALVYSLVAGRKLRFVRVGNGRGRIRIPEDAVEEYLARAMFGVEEKEPPRGRARLKHLKL